AGKRARALAATGVDVVDFSIGEPDFPTPAFVGQAGVRAIDSGFTKYTDVAGEAGLRDAIAGKYGREQGAVIGRENVIVTAGAKQAVYNVCQAIFDEGDEVALFSPYWVSFPEMLRLTGARPVFVETPFASGWHATAALLGTAKGRVRGVILNTPNNPTGAVVPQEELERIVAWCEAREAWLIYDETYDRFAYDGRGHASAAKLLPRYERIVVTGAASKTFAMTGWRLGWAVGAPSLVSAMTSYQSHTTSNASSISQAAVLEALTDLRSSTASVDGMLSRYAARRTVMVEGLAAVAGVRCPMPEGAFYAFPDVSALYERKGVSGSVGFCDKLLAEAHVAAVPGDAFGDDACVRFSFSSSRERIREGTRRFATWAKV
ncbi:MAG: pyridoxal phosphate-dependent aminotransferase, partial [Thermoanaerobaculia bacterium]|nr:pyridoxal phosphate-dependent aminotransferase [Thermoanaerobaculia bacterium]